MRGLSFKSPDGVIRLYSEYDEDMETIDDILSQTM